MVLVPTAAGSGHCQGQQAKPPFSTVTHIRLINKTNSLGPLEEVGVSPGSARRGCRLCAPEVRQICRASELLLYLVSIPDSVKCCPDALELLACRGTWADFVAFSVQ